MTPEERAARVAESVITLEEGERRCCVGVAGSSDLVLVTSDRAYAAEEAAAVRAAVAAAVAAAVRAAVLEEREACVRAVCEHCAAGNRAFPVEGTWVHAFFRGGKESRGGCLADAIRARSS